MNLEQLSHLDESQLNHLLLTYDNWSFDEEKNQVFKNIENTNVIFSLDDFSPFTKSLQAEIILRCSQLDFSLIQNDTDSWGFMVFEDSNKKYLLLKSDSKIKSSLLLIIAIKSGLLQT